MSSAVPFALVLIRQKELLSSFCGIIWQGAECGEGGVRCCAHLVHAINPIPSLDVCAGLRGAVGMVMSLFILLDTKIHSNSYKSYCIFYMVRQTRAGRGRG